MIALLTPYSPITSKDVGCTRIYGTVASLIAIDASCVAVLQIRPNHHRVARHSHGTAKLVIRTGVRGLEIGLLGPGCSAAHENICSTGVCSAVVGLIAVDTSRVAILAIRPDDHRVARNSQGNTKLVISTGVRSLEIGLLAPGRSAAQEHVSSAGGSSTVVTLIAVDPRWRCCPQIVLQLPRCRQTPRQLQTDRPHRCWRL